MKKILIVLFILSISTLGYSQGMNLGAAAGVVFPSGDFSEIATTGWSIDAYGVFGFGKLNLTARIGYVDFGEGEGEIGSFNELDELIKTNTTAVPLMVGARWDFGIGVGPGFYAGAEAGVHFFSTSAESAGIGGEAESDTKFAFAPILGLKVASFDISAYYMIIEEANYVGIRAGYGFGL